MVCAFRSGVVVGRELQTMKKPVFLFLLLLALSCRGEMTPTASPPQPGLDALRPSAEIDSVLVDGRAENLSRLPGPTPSIIVPPGPKRVEIYYSATNLPSSDQVRFRFRLQGLDKDWVDVGSSKSASYVMLPAGNYRFEVNVSGPNGIWHEGGGTLNIKVERSRVWFRVAVVAVFLLVNTVGFYLLVFRFGRHKTPTDTRR